MRYESVVDRISDGRGDGGVSFGADVGDLSIQEVDQEPAEFIANAAIGYLSDAVIHDCFVVHKDSEDDIHHSIQGAIEGLHHPTETGDHVLNVALSEYFHPLGLHVNYLEDSISHIANS
eukprot:CAMPEP_0170553696 /NCGR_PEP_ID=MMETSP0211-20121228/11514_1 /TAXON_ID=311385 /ORGANISM="Pseudokeronopsis sp., Strain OXSARD2" /LENGTH=118 /DNA_ID=CAMNT_0010862193 /DNA_START=37 /DNA_END=393 /DNA_ORIENTATION=-